MSTRREKIAELLRLLAEEESPETDEGTSHYHGITISHVHWLWLGKQYPNSPKRKALAAVLEAAMTQTALPLDAEPHGSTTELSRERADEMAELRRQGCCKNLSN